MFWNQEVVELVAADRQATLAHESCVRGMAKAGGRHGIARWLIALPFSRHHRRSAPSPSPWLWTRPLDLGNCESARGMPW